MSIHLFSDPACFHELHEEWQRLLDSLHVTNPFYSAAFARSWWETHQEGTLAVFVFRENEEIVGIFPLYQFAENGKVELRSLANHELSDYFDLIISPDHAERIRSEFVAFLREHREITGLNLLSLPEKSSTFAWLQKLAEEMGWRVEQHQQEVCPVITLPATWDEYLASIGKKQRHEIKRKWKNLEMSLQPTFSVVTDDANIEKDLSDFIQLHKLSGIEKATFWTPANEKYFRSVMHCSAKHGWLKLFFLEIDGARAATMLCFDNGETFYLYNSGYDPAHFAGQSVGNVLTSYTIRQAIEAGRHRYDFLRGSEEYKFRFRAVAEPIFDVEVMK